MTSALPAPPSAEIGWANPGLGYWASPLATETPELRWPNSVTVYDRMRRQDAQITSVLRAVSLPVRRTSWRLRAGDARPEVVDLVAGDLGLPVEGADQRLPLRRRDRFSWSSHVSNALLCLSFGHMMFEQVARFSEADRLWHLRKLAPRHPRTIAKMDVARDGGLVSITQHAAPVRPGDHVGQDPIPVDRLVAYVLDQEAGDWLGSSLLRPAYKHWLIKDRLIRIQAQTLDRNGMGIPVYTDQPGAGPDDREAGKRIATTVRAGDNAGAALPNGASLRLLGIEGQLPDADKAIRYHDESIGRAVLAHFLNLGDKTGSYALGTTFADFFVMSLQTLATQIADVAQAHVIEDLVDWNYGPDEPAPQIVFDEIGSRRDATAEAIRALLDSGAVTADPAMEAFLRQTHGLPPRTGPDPQQTEQPAPADQPGAA
ncbi:hypothetical protein GCM10027047_01580 [Rhodococcus aerolatus]